MPWAAVAAGISAVSSLLGGRKAAKEQRRAIAEQNAYNDPSAIRARAENAGFNPLLFVGPGVGQQTALASPVMGQAIANAGLAIADGVSDYGKQQAYATALEQQNAELRKAVETATLRPKMPGIYGTSQPMSVGRAPATSQGSVQLDGSRATGLYGDASLSYGDVESASIATPLIARNGEILPLAEGIDVEDWLSSIPMNAYAELQKDGTVDKDFLDRFSRNAEALTTAVARPVFKGAKALASAGVDYYYNHGARVKDRKRALQLELDRRFDRSGDAVY